MAVHRHMLPALLVLMPACWVDSAGDTTARYFGEVRWDESPLRMLPPIRDREGNVYLAMREDQGLSQTCGLPEAYGQVFVGHPRGGFSRGCQTQKNARPVHGWVGVGQKDAFIWSGDALVQVSGVSGGCTRLFATELTRRDEINMTAVIPWLWDRPAMRTMLALIWVAGDRLPYHAVLDLDRHVYTKHRLFSPAEAQDLVAIGAAGNLEARTGAMLLAYTEDDVQHIVALFLDENGDETARQEIYGLVDQEPPPGGWQDSAVGMPAMTSGGHVGALLTTGQLVVVSPTQSRVTTVTGLVPEGVQLWKDKLWLIGTLLGEPVIAPIHSNGTVGAAQRWTTSIDVAEAITDTLEVVDERITPRRVVTWTDSETAFGSFPLVAPFSLLPYDGSTVGWVVAGPSYDNGSYRCRSIAFMPVTASYP